MFENYIQKIKRFQIEIETLKYTFWVLVTSLLDSFSQKYKYNLINRK